MLFLYEITVILIEQSYYVTSVAYVESPQCQLWGLVNCLYRQFTKTWKLNSLIVKCDIKAYCNMVTDYLMLYTELKLSLALLSHPIRWEARHLAAITTITLHVMTIIILYLIATHFTLKLQSPKNYRAFV